ncbi:XdhC family protein [Marinobacterium aestuariivivens]|uniref:XdhC family protein n=1 Tax=Marinobacterium aestuariivivens TaxID=1698799 RepID=A0ABW2A602_9GAMM
MANQLTRLLLQWYPQRDALEWVLGTVYRTEGPSYRKAGAMMLFNSLGQAFGMLSGGCLESDIQRHARRVMQSGQALTLCYDGSDEDDLSFQLGIGCGGTVHILLQPIRADNDYLQPDLVHRALEQRAPGFITSTFPVRRAKSKAALCRGPKWAVAQDPQR